MKEKELIKKTSVVTQSDSNTVQISSGGGKKEEKRTFIFKKLY